MIKINNIKVPIDFSAKQLKDEIAKKYAIKISDISNVKMLKKSLDARRANNIHFIVSVVVTLSNCAIKLQGQDVEEYNPIKYCIPKSKSTQPPIVVGFGPAGIFTAYILAKAGLCPIIYERGCDIDTRKRVVDDFIKSGELDTKTNIQFGEGGAGAFSDGKLYSGINDYRRNFILETLHEFGAPEEILYSNKPHIGTDKLRVVVKNIRNKIIELGGQINFNSSLDDITIKSNKLYSISINSQNIPCENLILCVGHSSKDTFEMLYSKKVVIEQKDFSIGARIEHLQNAIDRAQYKDANLQKNLGASEYKLFSHLKNGRTVYTFCMCPGGEVVCASSHKGRLVTNGMSEFARDKPNANSAILVSVNKKDFQSQHPLAGMYFQEKYEKLCYEMSGSYKAPCVRVEDFLKDRTSACFGEVIPSYSLGTIMGDLRCCLPSFAIDGIKEGIKSFENKLKGFSCGDAVLTGIETRSSSPIRIPRDDTMQCNFSGLYPCGEGAGYSGGIMSSAIDGIKCAEALISKFNLKDKL